MRLFGSYDLCNVHLVGQDNTSQELHIDLVSGWTETLLPCKWNSCFMNWIIMFTKPQRRPPQSPGEKMTRFSQFKRWSSITILYLCPVWQFVTLHLCYTGKWAKLGGQLVHRRRRSKPMLTCHMLQYEYEEVRSDKQCLQKDSGHNKRNETHK